MFGGYCKESHLYKTLFSLNIKNRYANGESMEPRTNFPADLERLRKHLPDLRSLWGILRILAVPVLLFLLISQLFVMSDVFMGLWMLDAEVLALAAGFLCLYLFFRLREPLIEQYGEAAYARGFKSFIIPGLTIIVAVIVRIRFIGGPMVPGWLLDPVGRALGWLLILVGVLLWLRSVLALGIDSLTMTYVYFREEGHRTESAIYGLLRHPIYGAAVRISLGLALLNGSWFALTLALILSLFLWGWVRLVEEKELISRFGQDYEDYRRKTPAFWPRWQDMWKFVRFLILGR